MSLPRLPLRNFFDRWPQATRKQLITWFVSAVLLIIVLGIGRSLGGEQVVMEQLAILFSINSAVFLAAMRDYPKLGIVMVIFTYFLEIATLGYFLLVRVSFNAQ